MTLQRINSGRGHWYKIDGRKADGVTTLIKDGLPKPAIPYWAARTVAEYVADATTQHLDDLRQLGRAGMVNALKEAPWGQRDAAANRGTEVHRLAEGLVRGEEVEVPEPLAGHVDSYTRFLSEWMPAPVLIEATIAHRRWRYCGTLDLVCDLPDGRRVLMDIKTSRSGIWPETAYQLAAYRYAEVYRSADGDELPMVPVDAAYAIWVRADGYDLIPVECGERVFKDFCHIAWVARCARENKSLIGEAVQP